MLLACEREVLLFLAEGGVSDVVRQAGTGGLLQVRAVCGAGGAACV